MTLSSPSPHELTTPLRRASRACGRVADPRVERLKAMILGRSYPCVGAKSALAREQMSFVVARDIRSDRDDGRIYAALETFAGAYRRNPEPFQSLAVIFEAPRRLSEEAFEQALWSRAQALSDLDAAKGQPYDARVSADVESPRFSLSFAREAFYVVGLHPGASRIARRFETPVLVFNPHDQFERLREGGRYEPLRETIVERDVAVQGSANPMLARHGEISEARQYSGRVVGADWKCPFSAGARKTSRAS